MLLFCLIFFFFFFQAEDGIRDLYVTGVQTCALPISMRITVLLWPVLIWVSFRLARREAEGNPDQHRPQKHRERVVALRKHTRSEERRVGKECRSRRSPDYEKKKNEAGIIGRCERK